MNWWLAYCCVGRGKMSRNMTSRSLSDVDWRNSILRSLVVGTALTNHHNQYGPLGQFSGVGSMGGGGLQTFCMIKSYKAKRKVEGDRKSKTTGQNCFALRLTREKMGSASSQQLACL